MGMILIRPQGERTGLGYRFTVGAKDIPTGYGLVIVCQGRIQKRSVTRRPVRQTICYRALGKWAGRSI